MPTGIYKRTQQHNNNISLALKGKHTSPLTEFKSGHKMTSELKVKLSELNKIRMVGNKHAMGHTMSTDNKIKMSKRMSGANNYFAKHTFTKSKHWNWKGGVTKRDMNSKKYRLWRLSVFERDNFTCQKCKVRGGYLEADHIKPWVLYPKSRFMVSNGQTLCKKCHIIKTKEDFKLIKTKWR